MPSGDDIQTSVGNLTKKLPREAKKALNKDFTDVEIKETTFVIGATKAPGLDGFQAWFYHKY